jgi:hypothetical protein
MSEAQTDMTEMPNMDTPEGAEWLRKAILSFVAAAPRGRYEDAILRHVEGLPPDDYEGECPSTAAVDMLFEMVKDRSLTWHDGKTEDGPLLYRAQTATAQLPSPGSFLLWLPDDGESEADARESCGRDAESAATAFAKRRYSDADSPEEQRVSARGPDGEITTWVITAEPDVRFRTRRAEEKS